MVGPDKDRPGESEKDHVPDWVDQAAELGEEDEAAEAGADALEAEGRPDHIDIPPYLVPGEDEVRGHKQHRARRAIVNPLWALIAALVAAVLVYTFYLHVPAVVNGQNVRILRGSTVSQVMKQLSIKVRPGDMLDVKGGVYKKGGGEPPVYKVAGRPVGLSHVIESGQTVMLADGRTLREPTVRRLELIDGGTKLTGHGPFVVVADPGRPGIRRTIRGRFSHLLAERRVIRNPRAMILKRTSQRPMRVIALTFDDGPAPGSTERILKVLEHRHVKATFFVLGQRVQAHPDLVRAEALAGNVVGSHSFRHAQLTKLSQAAIEQDLDVTNRSIQTATKRRPHWFRPPYGSVNVTVLKVAASQHLRTVMWDIDTNDWRRPGWKAIYGRVMAAARPGAVVLMHDGGGDRSQTIMALPRIIDGLRRKGYSFVTVAQLGLR